ncbi:MAG: 3-hydroxyacyl-CoA dehydrogenase NAD-binding domain-containing protein [Phycisphaerales bacterium]|nr:3-hydroxyacyl-CoA dehydrogenase NAD-binding domain-containing protein [Phycisphaerales bacterium]
MNRVAVIGAGAMGAGIAQVAAQHGWQVHMQDVNDDVVGDAIAGIRKRFDRLVEKGRLTGDEAQAAHDRLQVVGEALPECDLVIEAIVEDMDVKAAVLGDIVSQLGPEAIIATNTSSLSVSELGERLGVAERCCGMHFFNPAPIMKLVEVVRGRETADAVLDRVADIAASWGKQVARCADTPGFIVNRVARPYYLEAFRIVEDGLASPEFIDHTMKSLGGFRMGPLELTDFIGHDVNTATTRTVWNQWNQSSRLAPSWLQESLVAEGHLGRKSGRGVYEHGGDAPVCVVQVAVPQPTVDDAVQHAANAFTTSACDAEHDGAEAIVFARILGALINEAMWAEHDGVATAGDIDTAVQYGVNYPQGLLTWRDAIGPPQVSALLQALDAATDDDRFVAPM